MGSSGSKAEFEKTTEQGSRSSFRWGASSMQGWPKYQEDKFTVIEQLGKRNPCFNTWAYFAVFDGHAGETVSDIASKQLIDCLIDYFSDATSTNSEENISEVETILPPNRTAPSAEHKDHENKHQRHVEKSNGKVRVTTDEFKRIIKQSFLLMDEQLRRMMSRPSTATEDVGQRFDPTDVVDVSWTAFPLSSYLANLEVDRSGSTVVTAIINRQHIFLAHCGDSRAILVTADDQIEQTEDHKPYNEKEKKRIQAAGGFVVNERVNGILAVSRALGDFDYKMAEDTPPEKQPVSPLPTVKYFRRHGKEEMLILACDGVWDVMTPEAVRDYTRYLLKCTKDMSDVCSKLIDTCLFKGSRDNITAVVVAFEGCAPSYSEEAAQKDRELDDYLKTYVDKLYSSGEYQIDSVSTLMSALSNENIENLPPGGGLASKRRVVEDVYHDHLRSVRSRATSLLKTRSSTESRSKKSSSPPKKHESEDLGSSRRSNSISETAAQISSYAYEQLAGSLGLMLQGVDSKKSLTKPKGRHSDSNLLNQQLPVTAVQESPASNRPAMIQQSTPPPAPKSPAAQSTHHSGNKN